MLEALEYTAMVLAPVFVGAVLFLIGIVIVQYFVNPYRVFRRKGPKVFRRR
jgi:hypothetical protein